MVFDPDGHPDVGWPDPAMERPRRSRGSPGLRGGTTTTVHAYLTPPPPGGQAASRLKSNSADDSRPPAGREGHEGPTARAKPATTKARALGKRGPVDFVTADPSPPASDRTPEADAAVRLWKRG